MTSSQQEYINTSAAELPIEIQVCNRCARVSRPDMVPMVWADHHASGKPGTTEKPYDHFCMAWKARQSKVKDRSKQQSAQQLLSWEMASDFH
eukprot:scaffold113062_cov22-Prasinocladus_malaysianus.AAC.1